MARFLRRRHRPVLIDVDTQHDLLRSDNSERADLLHHIRRLIAWARIHHIHVISTSLARRRPAAHDIPGVINDCIEGTPGQSKFHYTILPSRIMFEAENRFDLPRTLLSEYQQVIFEKRSEDPFVLPRVDRLLCEIKADRFIVFGMGLETSIKATVLGLISRGRKVAVVSDAVVANNPNTGTLALRQVQAKGAKLVTTASIAGKSSLCRTSK